jgi:anti-sigma regulatory factor (Ser/Thr protein kinase)
MNEQPLSCVNVELERVPISSSVARRHAISFLELHRREDLAHDAAMIVAELVSNAVMHGAEPIRLNVEMRDLLRIEVFDGDPRAEHVVPRAFTSNVPGGRGLRIVDLLASNWGAMAHADGKTVWAELAGPVASQCQTPGAGY